MTRLMKLHKFQECEVRRRKGGQVVSSNCPKTNKVCINNSNCSLLLLKQQQQGSNIYT